MESRIRQGFTCYVSMDKDRGIQSSYLKSSCGVMVPLERLGYEEEVLHKFPAIVDYLKQGFMLQVFYGDISSLMVAMIGKKVSNGPYGEDDCFDVMEIASHVDLGSTLIELDSVLENGKVEDFSYKKAYRLYGKDKYQFYTDDFKKENFGGK